MPVRRVLAGAGVEVDAGDLLREHVESVEQLPQPLGAGGADRAAPTLGELTRTREQVVPVAARLLGVRLEITQIPRTPVALREEPTATARERIWRLPYLRQVSRRLHWTVLGLSLALGAGIGAAIAIARSSSTAPAALVADTLMPTTMNRNLDPGSPLSATAPGFTLTDQFGKRVSLRSLRGKVVVVSFNDPECTTICPLDDDGPAPRQEAARSGRLPG